MKTRLLWVGVLAALAGAPGPLHPQVKLASQTAVKQEAYQPITIILGSGKIPAALASPVTLRVNRQPLERVLGQIAAQAGLGISFGPEVVQSRTLVTLDVKQKTAAYALANLERRIQWRVLATPSGKVTLVRREAPQAQGTITGRVVSAATQQPLSGASVGVEGTARGATTGADGRFSITGVPAGSWRVRVTRVGYAEQVRSVTVTTGATTTLDIEMAAQAVALEGVVAVGYGTQRRRDVTGAIGSVSTEELEKVQVPTIAQALQGRVAGVNVTQNSAAPGGGVSIRIRGSGSLGTTNEPLYVIDGVPISGGEETDPRSGIVGNRFNSPNPLAFLNPEDIASIEVLKDASSTAIYGARGSNGVVLITTKQGASGFSSMEFESSFATQSVTNRYDMLNAREFAAYTNDWVRIQYGDTVTVPFPNPAALGEGTDWQDVIFRDAPMMQHQVSILGGTDQTRFSISGNYTDQQGVVRSTEFQRYSLRGNIQHDVKNWLRVGTNLNVSRIHNSTGFSEGGARDISAGAVGSAQNFSPLIPVFKPDGSYATGFDVPAEMERFTGGINMENPLALIREVTDQGENDRVMGNLFAEFDLLQGMMLRLNGGANMVNNTRNEYFSSRTYKGGPPNNGIADLGVIEQSHYVGEAILNYRRQLGDLHRLDLTAGTTAEQNEWFRRGTMHRNFPNDIGKFYDIGAGTFAAGPSVESSFSDWSLLSYLGRANYSVADRYLFTLTGRADGSSKFGRDNKWGYFPSAAFAWRASEEPFLAGADWLSDLKLRVSYGMTGNQEIGSYRSLARWGLSNYALGGTIVSGFQPTSIQNPELRWEKSQQFDAGFDAAFLDNRFTMTFDVYEKLTDDLLLNVPLPFESGFSSALQNLGSVRNRGFEVAVGADVLEGYGSGLGGLEWRTSFNLSANRNEVVELGKRSEFLGSNFSGGVGLSGLLVREGLPMGVFYGYRTDGIFRSQEELNAYVGPDGKPIQPGAMPGQIRFVDQDGDGRITPEDRVVLGNPEPDFTLGWTNDFTLGAFNLYTFLQGSYGNEIFNVDLNQLARGGLQRNIYAPRYFDAWSPENPDGKWPVINVPPGRGYTGVGTRRGDYTDEHLYDGSYLRLRSLVLNYSLPDRFANRLAGMQNARIFVSGDNLFTWTSYPGVNPDVNTAGQNNINRGIDFNAYPLARVYRVGLRFGL